MKSTYIGRPIDFMKYYLAYFAISLVVILPGTYSLIRYGLKPSIDFTGGSLIELRFSDQLSDDQIKQSMPHEIEISNIQRTGIGSVLLRTKSISKEQNEQLKNALVQKWGAVEELRFETVGPILGQELIKKTITAICLSAILILLYIAYRFKSAKYGICAIIAMFHDSLVMIGFLSLLGFSIGVEIDTLFVTALLTILSFSVHDTIVVYDRIRESIRLFPRAHFVDLVNKSVNETLARSINNSMTIIFMLLALWLMGGETTKWFVFCLMVGAITGTYSSTFTAAPLLVLWDRLSNKKK